MTSPGVFPHPLVAAKGKEKQSDTANKTKERDIGILDASLKGKLPRAAHGPASSSVPLKVQGYRNRCTEVKGSGKCRFTVPDSGRWSGETWGSAATERVLGCTRIARLRMRIKPHSLRIHLCGSGLGLDRLDQAAR